MHNNINKHNKSKFIIKRNLERLSRKMYVYLYILIKSSFDNVNLKNKRKRYLEQPIDKNIILWTIGKIVVIFVFLQINIFKSKMTWYVSAFK